MSKNETKSLPVHEMDTNILFEKYSVDEIRDIEKRTRADIERKKEDLRTMVGERYRDLIEAADTIAEMKNSAEKVMSTIGRIETLCTELKHNQMVKSSSLQLKKKQEIEIRRKEEAKFHEVASQIKLLLDIPEKMWTCLDCEDYLSASRLYLLAQHINTSLQLTSQNAPNFLYWFPVLNRQWAAISHFKITILQGCRRLIKETTVSDQKIADSLCSILLLENSNPRQVFNEFLLARTSAIQQLFHVNSDSLGTKEQICTVVQLITTTIHQIYAVFYTAEGQDTSDDTECTNLLLRTLTKVTTQKQHESGLLDLHSSVSARCLPTSVTDFCPSHKSVSLGVSQQHLHDNCTQWIQTCINDVKSGVTTLLNFVNTVKHLASIRDTVWELMSQDISLKDWTVVCESVLSNSLHIWDDLLRPLFVDRVKALIKYQLEATVEITERQMNKVIVELDDENSSRLCVDTDLAGYIWSESPGDIAANTAWGMAGSRSLLESGGLMMKAKAYTPIVQTFCKTFDGELDAVSEDYKFYIFTDAETMSVAIETTPFNQSSVSTSLLTFVQTSCMECVQGILEFLTKLLDDCRADLSSSKLRCSNIGNKLLLSGRLCAAMCDLTPHLQQCMMGSEQVSRMDRSLLKRSTSGRHVIGKQESNVIWENIKSQLIKYQQTAFRLWIDHVIEVGLGQFTMAVNAVTPAELIATCSRWDEVSIEEETEDGKKIMSKISVPMQASWYMMSLLYSLCNDLNNIGGHAVARSVLEHLVCSLSDGIINTYKALLNQSSTDKEHCVNQQRALQLIFDVKFLRMIIPRKDDSPESKRYQKTIEEVLTRLEEIVDPFDLDVFSPFMQANLTKVLQRSAVLLGGLTSLDKSGLYGLTTRPAPSSQQEQHNVLMLSTCHSRFSLLPLSVQQSRMGVPQPVISQTLYRGGETSGPSLAETAAAVLPHNVQQKMNTSSSFYDRIGSMSDISNWFSNIAHKS
ncbi:LOW QUALITY PROTEIN: conserved oligomeric Golgi complex subunit 1-like [Ruditapes philippinarum]|uniref:LOW QUALITY PROTEIN: conserved oligomeric Golgi complex subunit 1-like n=1 Tax=Ruditapes philippinarum TaxID=129788 RepID=UPI00295BB8DD|nr:LOW QUALITY PROTEIN: conserved oligomeric Golgi complex subunit 1-like [Ruditapes philippinarum]